ncbi:DUF2911 domain-containing protein [Polaribacter gangjinensis]|uniref:Asparagine synthetase B n=1 Tax=Polaribacter gangjinensis TaxID=574710 RepID=A0A2S7WBX3_9FLAO|nr:DUF2911 domain-containing protein [Polaribacter gangjinensis]PQJ75123.1 asparagine synthetase B [Polaribacter gangjinensis]
MKKSILFFALCAIFLGTSSDITAQKFVKIDASPMDAAAFPSNWREANKLVKVVYSRPQLKGRTIDKLAPNDKVWRTGANEATEITFYKNVVFGGKEVAAGTYTLFTIPTNEDWTVILSKQKNVWGSYFYDEKDDVVRVKGTVTTSEEPIEAFSIVFEGENNDATMYLGWGNKIVSVPVKG